MGRTSRMKRDRREEAGFAAALTACQGTWLERRPAAEELSRCAAARRVLQQHRAEAQALGADQDAFNRFSLELFREERFTPLHFDDWVIELLLEQLGEPPVVEDDRDPAFSNYLREAVGLIASARVRRAMAEQIRRFIPAYVEAGQIREALVIEHNAYTTVMSDAVTPLLVQMLVGGLARWYEEHEEEPPEESGRSDNAA